MKLLQSVTSYMYHIWGHIIRGILCSILSGIFMEYDEAFTVCWL